MLFLVVIFIVELLALLILSKLLITSLYRVFYVISNSRLFAIAFVTLVMFPGTVVHELSHMFIAEILGVPTGSLQLAPEIIRGKEEVTSGSVKVAQSDPLRHTLIGLAPVYVGIGALFVISYFLPGLWHTITNTPPEKLFATPALYFFFLCCYLMFTISTNMFSSPKDLDGVMPVIILLSIIGISLFIFGFRLNLTGTALTGMSLVLTTLVRSLGYVVGLNVLLYLVNQTILFGLLKIKRRR